jgi:hypothetical protein
MGPITVPAGLALDLYSNHKRLGGPAGKLPPDMKSSARSLVLISGLIGLLAIAQAGARAN